MKSEPEIKSVSSNGRGKRYNQEFQKEAVRLLEAGRPAAQLARELGVSTWSLGQWKKRHGTGWDCSAFSDTGNGVIVLVS